MAAIGRAGSVVMFRFVVLASVAVLFWAPRAEAFDYLSPGYEWSGLYAGVNAGIVTNESSIKSSLTTFDDRYDPMRNIAQGDQSSLMGGATLGYSLQAGHFVFGAEADLNYLGYSDTSSKLKNYDLYSATRQTTFDASWFGSLRGRAGLAAGGFLLYGTAGLAAGSMQATATVKAVDVVSGDVAKWQGSTDTTNWGWTAGAGLEYGISNVSFGVEFLYVDLGSTEWSGDFSGADGSTMEDATLNGSADYQFTVTRATAKLHF